MTGSYKKSFIIGVFLSAFSFIALNGCATGKAASVKTVKIKGKKEILVARDIGRGDAIYFLRWCGNRGLVYRGDNVGVEVLDFLSKERKHISLNRYDTLLNCSPDGKRVLYMDEKSVRSDEEIEEPVELFPGVFGGLGHTVDMYVYDTLTGQKTLVARTRSETPYDALSPDGSKVLLGEKHRLAEKVAIPEWEGMWFTKKWKPYDATWFHDSSGVITYGEGSSNIICVEFFGNNGWAGCSELKVNSDALKVDRGKRVYFIEEDWDAGYRYLHQCEIKDRELLCERVLKEYDDVTQFYGLLPDGDIVFEDYDNDDCIRRATPGGEDARCVIYQRYADIGYDGLGLLGVSPDGRWLVFERHKSETKPDGKVQIDLFVIDLKND